MMGEMDHSEVRGLLEDAAVEPGGLERLMAGDTPNAVLVAGHLAGCPECSVELEGLRRSVGVIRPAMQMVPPPELRQRTLDYVAAMGRPRVGAAPADSAAAGSTASRPGPAVTSATDRGAGSGLAAGRSGSRLGAWTAGRPGAGRLRVLAVLAAALVVAVTGTTLIVNDTRDGQARGQAAEIEALGDVARWTLRVDGQGDAQRITLASTTGDATSGTLLYSPTSTELIVVAEALVKPKAGYEYRCWLEAGGKRAAIGRMFFGGDLAYWVGKVPQVAGLGAGARFGVSLVDLASSDAPGQPILVSGG
jgi:hypothetical protein